jgi:phycocyanobilin:ferredoxin oxidoreductase
MSQVWQSLINIQNLFENIFSKTGREINEPGMERFNQPGWINRVWSSDNYRRAHVDVVDARNSRGLWMMHCCVFPHIHNPAPIFGFDVIAGKNKITGCFIDYSPTGQQDHPMIKYFAEEVDQYDWIKKRELPDWAQRIFSPYMVAAGNVQDNDELNQIESLAQMLISHYVDTVGETNHTAESTVLQQNFYAQNQKQNPHTPRVMTSLGLNEEDVRIFIQECLFPEIQ